MPDFIPGQELCREFYSDVIEPVISVPHAAGLLGGGSDVLGYDTDRSTDHDWGPRCHVFVAQEDVSEVRQAVMDKLPERYAGWPVAIGRDDRPAEPNVVVTTLSDWVSSELGWQLGSEAPLSTLDWLVIPQTRLLGITQGAVFEDAGGELTRLRRMLAWYPEPVWWWLMGCQWQRLAQEEPFVQRTAEAGDDLGSRLIAARLVRDCMRLALLMAKRFAPYSKWLGSAFARLPDPDGLGQSLVTAVDGTEFAQRDAALGAAYRALAARFNQLSAELDLDVELQQFHDRPARVLGAERFADATLSRVQDEFLCNLPLVGSVDQVLDSTDVLAHPTAVVHMRAFYQQFAA